MEVKTEKYRRTRGALLKILAKNYPGAVDSKVLSVLATELGFEMDDNECSGHIAYLAEKEFARSEKRKAAGIVIELVRITAKGLDLLDGIAGDAGIDARF